MGQMFFDISALANYFLTQKDQVNSGSQAKTAKSGNISFKDFLASLSGKESSRNQGADSAIFAQAFPVLPATQIILESNNVYEDKPLCAIQKNVNSNLNQSVFENYIQKANQVYPADPIETFEASIIPANELKGMMKSQAVPVTLNLNQIPASIDNYTDLKLLNNLNQVDLASLSFLGVKMAGSNSINPADTIANSNPKPASQGNSIDLSSYSKLSFTIDQLVSEEQKYLDITAFDQNNNIFELKAPVEQLKQVVQNRPENIIVQIKPNDNSKHSDMIFNSIQTTDKTEKYLLFDLKSLIKAEDFDEIKIVQKAVSNNKHINDGRSRSSDIDLLNSIKFNNRTGINARDNSALYDRMTELNKILSQSATGSKGAFSFNLKDQALGRANYDNTKTETNSGSDPDQTTEASYNYSDIKASEVVQTQKGVGSFSNRSINEVNSTQYLNLKSANPQINFKSQELLTGKNMSSDTWEMTEKIIGQIKSKFAVTPEHTRMTINLKPESLGKIKIDFEYEGEKIKALLQVDNIKVKSILDADLPRLKNELKIDSIKVEITLSDFKQNSNTPNQRSHFAKHENYPLHHHSEFNESDEAGKKINSEIAKSAKVNVYNGGIINLFA